MTDLGELDQPGFTPVTEIVETCSDPQVGSFIGTVNQPVSFGG